MIIYGGGYTSLTLLCWIQIGSLDMLSLPLPRMCVTVQWRFEVDGYENRNHHGMTDTVDPVTCLTSLGYSRALRGLPSDRTSMSLTPDTELYLVVPLSSWVISFVYRKTVSETLQNQNCMTDEQTWSIEVSMCSRCPVISPRHLCQWFCRSIHDPQWSYIRCWYLVFFYLPCHLASLTIYTY